MLIRRVASSCSNAVSLSQLCGVSSVVWEQRVACWERHHSNHHPHHTLTQDNREAVVAGGTVLLPNHSVLQGCCSAWEVAQRISPSLAKRCVVAELEGHGLWDMRRPLPFHGADPLPIRLLTFDDPQGKSVFWHSSAHILGYAVELLYGPEGALLLDGPATAEGFFYDAVMGAGISEMEVTQLRGLVQRIVEARLPFQRLEVSREVASEMVASHNPYKEQLLNKIPNDGTPITVYRCGDFVDLCRGPHLPHTGMAKGFDITGTHAVVNKGMVHGRDTAVTVQRIHGISFPSKKELEAHKTLMAERARRDHRLIGREQKLWEFHPWSPGSAFFLPHGTRLFNGLVEFVRQQYRRRGFEEVMTPLIFHKELFEQSGHLENYADNIFGVASWRGCCSQQHLDEGGREAMSTSEGSSEVSELMALKPMNCPGHCLLFASRNWSYRDLPVRWADFSSLHRDEVSGALGGMTRLRRFHQDDAHIFCREDQVGQEIDGCLQFIKEVYDVFGLEPSFRLSTRPDKFVGSPETWDAAESALQQSLDTVGLPWELNPGDGAFYGPKIDCVVTDALQRQHQCATIQLDFQLPQRFNLRYQTAEGNKQYPVMIHRAILGSLERFLAILTEHVGGKWPFWISPRQVLVVPVSSARHMDRADEVRSILHENGYHVELDSSDNTLPKKIRNAQMAQFNFILVIGDREVESHTVSVRTRDNVDHGAHPLDWVMSVMKDL